MVCKELFKYIITPQMKRGEGIFSSCKQSMMRGWGLPTDAILDFSLSFRVREIKNMYHCHLITPNAMHNSTSFTNAA